MVCQNLKENYEKLAQGASQIALAVIDNIALPLGRIKGKMISFTFTGGQVHPESASSPNMIDK